MYKLTVRLPPFAPDYSGACSALFELGGMIVIHDASGCTGNYTAYDEPRWYDSRSLIYCSGLREMDAIFGNDNKFIDEIANAAAEVKPNFICMLGSPVPMVIGSDFKGIAVEIENRTGIPAFGFATTGLQYYDKGAADAFLAIAKRFTTRAYKKEKNTINLLGATPLDFGTGSNVKDYRHEFEVRGFKVLATYAMDCDMEQIKKSSASSVNVVISASALPLAEYFSQIFNTPYVIGQPIGKRHSDKLCQLIEEAQQRGENQVFHVPRDHDANVLLIGEQVTMHSLRSCLYEDLDIATDIGCPFKLISHIASSSDFALPSEKSIINAVNSNKYTHVIADPLIQELIKKPLRFVPLPHVAVSSKVHWNNPPELAGEKVKTILRGVL
jgi:hypothetical protein